MADENSDKGAEQEVHLVADRHTGEEIALGISAKVDKAEPLELREGMSAKLDQKGMTGQGKPLVVPPPPKPADAANSAKPKK